MTDVHRRCASGWIVDVRAASARQPGNPIMPANSAVVKRTGEKARTAGQPSKKRPSAIRKNDESLYQILMPCLYLLDVRAVACAHPSCGAVTIRSARLPRPRVPVQSPHGILESRTIFELSEIQPKRNTRLDESTDAVCRAGNRRRNIGNRAAVMRSVPTSGADKPCRRAATKWSCTN